MSSAPLVDLMVFQKFSFSRRVRMPPERPIVPECQPWKIQTIQWNKFRTATSVTPSNSLSKGSKYSKKSSLVTCLGTTHKVSMSEPGPCTPSRYDPKVNIFPPAESAADSDKPLKSATLCTNFLTNWATRPKTISLWFTWSKYPPADALKRWWGAIQSKLVTKSR